jgi:hypothetical protein
MGDLPVIPESRIPHTHGISFLNKEKKAINGMKYIGKHRNEEHRDNKLSTRPIAS